MLIDIELVSLKTTNVGITREVRVRRLGIWELALKFGLFEAKISLFKLQKVVS